MKLYTYPYHSGAVSPVGKITRRYLQLILLPVLILFGLYTANQLLHTDNPIPDSDNLSLDKLVSHKDEDDFIDYFDDIPSTTMLPNMNVSKPHIREILRNERTQSRRPPIQYAACAEAWKGHYPLTGYRLPNGSFCRGSACDLNYGREPIKVDKTKSKYQCNSLAECVTVTVKTQHRFNVTARLINSVHKYYPEIQVIVTDDEDTQFDTVAQDLFRMLNRPNNVRYDVVPPKVGEGRKVAVAKARTPYVMVVDDDHIFINKSHIMTMLDVLQHTDASIVGGDHVRDWKNRFQGVLHFGSDQNSSTSNTTLEIYEKVFHETVNCFPGCYAADIVKNLFMADKEAILNAGSWDSELFCWEHEEFFCTMRRSHLKIVFCEGVEFLHISPGYELRKKRKQLKPSAMNYIFRKWQLNDYYLCTQPHSYFKYPLCPENSRFVPD